MVLSRTLFKSDLSNFCTTVSCVKIFSCLFFLYLFLAMLFVIVVFVFTWMKFEGHSHKVTSKTNCHVCFACRICSTKSKNNFEAFQMNL